VRYLVELYAPLPGDFGELDRRVRAAAEQLASEGVPLRHERSILVPADEMCLLIYDAPTAELALEASRRAGLVSERVVEAIEVDR
jgi:hypothetical protein